MGSRISRLFNGLMLYILFLLTFHIPVAEEGLFLHQTQVSTGIMYISHIFLWGGSLIMHSTWRTTIFYAFSNNYQTAFIYHMWIPAVKSMCVWRICMPLRTYMWNVHEVEVEWPFQSALHFLSTYLVWYVWWVVHGMSLWWRSRSRRLPHKTEDSRQNTYIYIWMLMYLPVQVHVRIPFHFLREKLQCYLIRVFVFRTVARGIFVCISPYRKHATTAAVAIGDATSTRAVVNLRCIMEYGYEYAYYFFGSSTYLGMRVPGTWYQVHFSSYKYFVPRKKKTLTTQQDQQH